MALNKSFRIDSASEFRNTFKTFACIIHYNDMCNKDFVSWHWNFIDAGIFSGWLLGKGEITAEDLVSLMTADNLCLADVATAISGKFYKERMGYDKFYCLLAEFIGKFDAYKEKLFELITDDEDYIENIMEITAQEQMISLGKDRKSDIKRIYDYRKSISLTDRFMVALDIKLSEANKYDNEYIKEAS